MWIGKSSITCCGTSGESTDWTMVTMPRSPDRLTRKLPMAWISAALIRNLTSSMVRTMSMYFLFWLGSAV